MSAGFLYSNKTKVSVEGHTHGNISSTGSLTDTAAAAAGNDILNTLSIEHLAMRDFNELSAGQHQKVMLARGLVRSPPVVLLDEPTSNLDIRHQIEVTKILSEMPKKKNSIVIMISHDINITAKYADKILMISGGGIYSYGTPSEVLTKEALRDVYGVDADIIEVNGRPHVILNDSIPLDD